MDLSFNQISDIKVLKKVKINSIKLDHNKLPKDIISELNLFDSLDSLNIDD